MAECQFQVENFRLRKIQQKFHPTQDALFNPFRFMGQGTTQVVHGMDI
uniref:Uncharacterized protein n=1 Tax=Romanomermis culicivorax TaxID=13658 RepID=A0A915HV92_ROMCU